MPMNWTQKIMALSHFAYNAINFILTMTFFVPLTAYRLLRIFPIAISISIFNWNFSSTSIHELTAHSHTMTHSFHLSFLLISNTKNEFRMSCLVLSYLLSRTRFWSYSVLNLHRCDNSQLAVCCLFLFCLFSLFFMNDFIMKNIPFHSIRNIMNSKMIWNIMRRRIYNIHVQKEKNWQIE